MRQRNYVEMMPRTFYLKFAADYLLQFFAVDELHDSQPSYGNDETGPQNLNFVVHPRRAIANLIWHWNAIRAAGIFPRKTPADCREINFRSNCGLVHTAKLFEPSKKSFTSGMCKRPLQDRFARTGRLPDDHDVADDCAARDRRRFHARAAPATQQLSNMPFELQSFSIFDTHRCGKL